MTPFEWFNRFRQIVEQPDEQINVAEAALVIATDEYPDLDIANYLARLDALADAIRARVIAAPTPHAKIETLNKYVFDELHLDGNREFYYDPRNSYLNDVIIRRVGLPITLSLLYIEIGRRLNLPFHGVGLPGHFLVKWKDEQQEIFVDPFNEGKILDSAGIANLLENIHSRRVPLQHDWLEAVGPRYILSRLLLNLKNIFQSSGNDERALPVVEKLLLLEPNEEYLLDAGMLSFRAGLYQRAASCLEDYLLNHRDETDTTHVRIYLHAALVAVQRAH